MLFKSVTDLRADSELVRRRAYGVIEFERGRFVGIHFRPWPKLISGVEAAWIGGWKHKRHQRDRILLYYNQPMLHRNYLVLPYILSNMGTTYATLRRSMAMLDQVAMIKRSDALFCEITYDRVPDRLMKRWGWERHLEQSKKRHWIKRFYGDYSSVENRVDLEASNV